MALKIYENLEQGTPAWLDVRLGVITGTGLGKIMGTPAVRAGYLRKLCSELRRVGNPQVKNYAMKRGNDLEDVIQMEYERLTGQKVKNIGFATKKPYWGHSPDGIIYNDDGEVTKAIEIKSPYGETITKYISYEGIGTPELTDLELLLKIDKDYYWQVINYFCVFPDLEQVDFLVGFPYDTTLNKYNKHKRFKDVDLLQYKTGSTMEDEIFIYTIHRHEVEHLIEKAEMEVLKFRKEWVDQEIVMNNGKMKRGLKYLTKMKRGKSLKK